MNTNLGETEPLNAAPRAGARTFLASLLVWNPALAAAMSFAVGGAHEFSRRWFISVVITEVVAVQCFAAAHALRWLELRWYRARKRDAPIHGLGWDFALAGIAMPFALPVGFQVGGATARWLGFSWATLDFGAYRTGLGFGVLFMLLFFFQRAQSDAREVAREAEARIKSLEAARLQAQLAALTAEMNPHLLFNALNTVASLIHSNPNRAEEVVLQLSDLYRGVLRASGRATHTLQDELELCEAYLKIEQARFGERLSAKVFVVNEVDARSIQVPVLILQPLVENAVKHGVSPRALGGKVEVSVARQGRHIRVCVEDDGVGFGQSPHRGSGKAMVNCEDRLRLTYGEEARLEIGDANDDGSAASGARVVVTLPASVQPRSIAT